jgi:GNAT superfamily N-acetyltransferase
MTSDELQTNELSKKDLDPLAELFVDYLAEFKLTSNAADVRQFLSGLLEFNWVWGLAVFHQGKMIAFCLCTFNYSQAILGRALQVEDFFVAASFRRRGVGAVLLAGIEDHAKREGIRRLFGLALPAEREYFRRAGWEPTEHTLMMRKIGEPIILGEQPS